jgi:hypothetical protein
MAAITWAHVVDHYAGLSTVDTDAQTDILAHVNGALNVSAVGGSLGEASPRLKLARVHLAAHYALLSAQAASGAAGPVVSETVGQVSRTYANPFSFGSVTRGTNAAGDAFLALVKASPARAPVVL